MMKIWEGYRRDSPAHKEVQETLAALEVSPPRSFIEFFNEYEGVFGSSRTSFELCALCDAGEETNLSNCIPLATQSCRDVHGLPPQFLVISNMVGLAVLVYDTERDLVFTVDFEGGDELLKHGKLHPSFNSFSEFLEWYFVHDDDTRDT
jgi:hypothetical protein